MANGWPTRIESAVTRAIRITIIIILHRRDLPAWAGPLRSCPQRWGDNSTNSRADNIIALASGGGS